MLKLDQRGFVRTAKAALPAVVLALGLAGALAPVPAQAQFFNWGWGSDGGAWDDRGDYGVLGPGQIYRAVGEQGFRVVAPLRRNGAVFVAEVIDRRGRRERLIVSASNGQILQRFVFTDRRIPRSAGLMQGDDMEGQMGRADPSDLAPPVPPASIPGAQRRVYVDPDGGDTTIDPAPPRSAPKILRATRPRLVDRNPETDQPDSQPTRIRPRPSEPMRLPSAPPATAMRSVEPPVSAGRPAEPSARPAASQPDAATANAAPTSRMRDPLAIPRSEPKPAPASSTATAARRVQPGTVTGAPAAAPPQPPAPPASAKAADVPVAPLD